jgi:hypothetical protein
MKTHQSFGPALIGQVGKNILYYTDVKQGPWVRGLGLFRSKVLRKSFGTLSDEVRVNGKIRDEESIVSSTFHLVLLQSINKV